MIIEAALLTDDEKVSACTLAKAAGADFVKTSTGFAKGGATVADVALMRRVVGPDMGVKAAGGVTRLRGPQGDGRRRGLTRRRERRRAHRPRVARRRGRVGRDLVVRVLTTLSDQEIHMADAGGTGAPSRSLPWVVVRVGDSRMGIPSAVVREMLELPAIARVPGLPPDIPGVMTWRGHVAAR